MSSQDNKNQTNKQYHHSFSTNSSGDFKRPSYTTTISGGEPVEVFFDEEGYRFYLVPVQPSYDNIDNLVIVDGQRMMRMYIA